MTFKRISNKIIFGEPGSSNEQSILIGWEDIKQVLENKKVMGPDVNKILSIKFKSSGLEFEVTTENNKQLTCKCCGE